MTNCWPLWEQKYGTMSTIQRIRLNFHWLRFPFRSWWIAERARNGVRECRLPVRGHYDKWRLSECPKWVGGVKWPLSVLWPVCLLRRWSAVQRVDSGQKRLRRLSPSRLSERRPTDSFHQHLGAVGDGSLRPQTFANTAATHSHLSGLLKTWNRDQEQVCCLHPFPDSEHTDWVFCFYISGRRKARPKGKMNLASAFFGRCQLHRLSSSSRTILRVYLSGP